MEGLLIRDVSQLTKGGASSSKDAKLKTVTNEFESIFMSMLMKTMRNSVMKSDLLNGGQGEEIFTGYMDSILARKSAQSGKTMGIGDMLYKTLSSRLSSSKALATYNKISMMKGPN